MSDLYLYKNLKLLYCIINYIFLKIINVHLYLYYLLKFIINLILN